MTTGKLFLMNIALVLLCSSASAQYDCDADRYANTSYFADIKSTKNVVYGSNRPAGSGTTQTLRLDVYEPETDSVTNRPLIILAHGGSFIGGNRNECAPLCNSFAKMGYVAATIDYRIGLSGFPPDEVITTLAVVYAMHDMKAAVRFFRKDATNGNTYNIDTNRIIIGGISAGAITAIQAAYLDDILEIPEYLANDTAGLGGVEGKSGNPGYTSKVHGVVNYAGAIGDTSWINAGDPPITSFHYISDATVPFDTREVKVSGLPTGLIASGSGSMETRLNNVSVVNELTTYPGVGHVEFLSGSEYDSVINSTMMFLYNNVVCKQASTGMFAQEAKEISIEVHPNPSSAMFVVKWKHEPASLVAIDVYNSMGELVHHAKNKVTQEITLDLGHLSKGLYVVSLAAQQGTEKILGLEKIVVE
jgi:acetyl esterase/lipase